MNRFTPLSILLYCSLLLLQGSAYASLKPEVSRFIDEVVKEHALDKMQVTQLLEQAEFKQEIIDKMTGRAEKKAWFQYRPIFLNEKRINQGVKFWRDNEALLSKVEQHYGVAAEIIVAILGVETYYGTGTGKTRVLDALYTLAFSYPKRAAFFTKELKQFLLLASAAGFDPAKVKGSYAGAMGASQFISSSYRHYAVDFDRDGKTDLWNSPSDIIASVASYFAEHNWEPGAPVAIRASQVDPKRHQHLFLGKQVPVKKVIQTKDRPQLPVSDLTQAGIKLETAVSGETRTYLMPFEKEGGGYDYWAGFDNFYVITRYNRSPLYAMAVYQLSREIADRYKKP
jgi:membrane-bound lytic murein transglycosylase B